MAKAIFSVESCQFCRERWSAVVWSLKQRGIHLLVFTSRLGWVFWTFFVWNEILWQMLLFTVIRMNFRVYHTWYSTISYALLNFSEGWNFQADASSLLDPMIRIMCVCYSWEVPLPFNSLSPHVPWSKPAGFSWVFPFFRGSSWIHGYRWKKLTAFGFPFTLVGWQDTYYAISNANL